MAQDDKQGERPFDLSERTACFGEAVIAFAKRVPRNAITLPLIDQLVRSGTSVGANYCDADESVSKKDFRCNIARCKKEAKEAKHWLRMIVAAEDGMKEDARILWQEAKETASYLRRDLPPLTRLACFLVIGYWCLVILWSLGIW